MAHGFNTLFFDLCRAPFILTLEEDHVVWSHLFDAAFLRKQKLSDLTPSHLEPIAVVSVLVFSSMCHMFIV